MALCFIAICGFAIAEEAAVNAGVNPENIRSVTLTDPAPEYDPITKMWGPPKDYNPDGTDSEPKDEGGIIVSFYSSSTGQINFRDEITIENFGKPLLGYPEVDESPKEVRIVLNAVSPKATEVMCLGKEAILENWTIKANGQTVYVFSEVALKTGEKFGARMNISDSAHVQLFDQNGIEANWVDFSNEKPSLLYHRVPDGTGEWQWIMGTMRMGSHY